MPTTADLITKLKSLDWDFSGDKSDSPFADLHFHPGRFPSQIPAALIGVMTSPNDLVLDPFCGSGTTLIEAQRLQRQVIGIDLNPISCHISRAKTISLFAKQIEEDLLGAINRYTDYRLSHGQDIGLATCPDGVQGNKWYHPDTLNELNRIWQFIKGQPPGVLYDLLLFGFSSSLIACCSETRSWGYICDNVQPLQRRYVDADSVFRQKLAATVEAYKRRDTRRDTQQEYPAAIVLEGDAAARLSELKEGSVDLVVTSPPYFGVIDYVKAQRLTLEWMEQPIEPLRSKEIGARSKRARQSAFQQYMDGLEAVIFQTCRVLKSGKPLAIVIGESSHRIAVHAPIQKLIARAGFNIEVIFERKIGPHRRQPVSVSTELLIIATKEA